MRSNFSLNNSSTTCTFSFCVGHASSLQPAAAAGPSHLCLDRGCNRTAWCHNLDALALPILFITSVYYIILYTYYIIIDTRYNINNNTIYSIILSLACLQYNTVVVVGLLIVYVALIVCPASHWWNDYVILCLPSPRVSFYKANSYILAL